MEKRLVCMVKGRVQMVMFRDFTQRIAQKLKITGTVENNSDGSVSVVAQGEERVLKEFIEDLRRGSLFSRVDSVDVVWSEPLGKFKSFDILY